MKNWIIGGLIFATGIAATGLVIGGSDEREEDEGYSRFGISRQDIAPVKFALYQQECGSCHFAYQPGLLPAASWQRIMSGLEEHFGENAELDAGTSAQLSNYLVANAADRVSEGRSLRIAGSLRGEVPLRITDTVYFARHHDEINPRMVKNNPDIGSFSRCDVCHTGANSGIYDEDHVRIPGLGRWED
jgi:hypothetical protein